MSELHEITLVVWVQDEMWDSRSEICKMRYAGKPAVKTFEQTACTYGNLFLNHHDQEMNTVTEK